MATTLVIVNQERNEKIELDVTIDREDDQWIASVEAFGISTYGDDRTSVRNDVLGLTLHFLNSVEADGERERILDRHEVEVMPLDDPTLAIEDSEPMVIHNWIAAERQSLPSS